MTRGSGFAMEVEMASTPRHVILLTTAALALGLAACGGDQNGIWDGQPSARTLNRPTDSWKDESQLLVADQANHRVLIWTSFPHV